MIRFLFLILVLGSPLYARFPQQTTETAATQKKDPGILEGKAVNAMTGEPVPRALVTVYPAAHSSDPPNMLDGYAMETDENGTFHFEKLHPGKYQVSAYKSGYLRSAYGARRINGPGIPVALEASQTLGGVDIRLWPQAVVSGVITDDHGEPMPTCEVQLVKREWVQGSYRVMAAAYGATDNEGVFRISSVEPGKYYLQGNCSRFYIGQPPQLVDRQGNAVKTRLITTYYGDSSNMETASLIQIQAGQNLSGLNLRMRREPVFSVSGKIVSVPAGHLPTSYAVHLTEQSALAIFWAGVVAQTNRNGEFKLQNVPPGVYQLTVSESGSMGPSVQVPLDVSGDMSGLEISVPAPGDIQGRVRVEPQSGAELSAINLSLSSKEGMVVASSRVNPSGVFTFRNVTPGRYELSMDFLGTEAFIKSVRIGQKETSDAVMDLTQGLGPADVTISLFPAKLEGVVMREGTDASQQSIPATAVNVAAVPVDFPEMNTQLLSTDDQGRFSTKSLRPGRYWLFAAEGPQGDQWLNPELRKALEPYGVQVEVAEKDFKQVQLKLIPEVTVTLVMEKLGL